MSSLRWLVLLVSRATARPGIPWPVYVGALGAQSAPTYRRARSFWRIISGRRPFAAAADPLGGVRAHRRSGALALWVSWPRSPRCGCTFAFVLVLPLGVCCSRRLPADREPPFRAGGRDAAPHTSVPRSCSETSSMPTTSTPAATAAASWNWSGGSPSSLALTPDERTQAEVRSAPARHRQDPHPQSHHPKSPGRSTMEERRVIETHTIEG